jgi:Na+/pantothenate symporter
MAVTGSTTVSQLLMGLSTSATGLSTNNHLSIIHAGTITYNIGNQWVLTTSAIIEVALSTTYRMVCQPSFGTASRLQFNSTNSFFRAVRIG